MFLELFSLLSFLSVLLFTWFFGLLVLCLQCSSFSCVASLRTCTYFSRLDTLCFVCGFCCVWVLLVLAFFFVLCVCVFCFALLCSVLFCAFFSSLSVVLFCFVLFCAILSFPVLLFSSLLLRFVVSILSIVSIFSCCVFYRSFSFLSRKRAHRTKNTSNTKHTERAQTTNKKKA